MRKSQRGTLRRRRGMTLIEIMIVIVIMAMIATGTAMVLYPNILRSQEEQTRVDIRAIRSAALQYVMNEGDCPADMHDLIGPPPYVERDGRTVDAWGNDFSIDCDDYGVQVASAGHNGEWGDDDDLP